MNTDCTKRLLRLADRAYRGGQGRITEELDPAERGDGLATFIRHEIGAVTEGCLDHEAAREAALTAMRAAEVEVGAVVQALERARK